MSTIAVARVNCYCKGYYTRDDVPIPDPLETNPPLPEHLSCYEHRANRERSKCYNPLPYTKIESHHIIQDAAVRDLPNYSPRKAPTVLLSGKATDVGSPHYDATRVQDNPSDYGINPESGTFAIESQIAAQALRAASLGSTEISYQMDTCVDNYFRSIGVNSQTQTRPPGNRH